MNAAEIQRILSAQRTYFASGATLDVDFRTRMLKILKTAIAAHEADIARALEAELAALADA